jgi:glycosyltransferase involved in cell wall biosynthesis
VSERPLRIAFASYRGNMKCGGQGIYLWFLARELAALGHQVDVYVGPPYPDPMPFAEEVHELPNEQFWGKWFSHDWPAFVAGPNPLRLLSPLQFYELGASRFGFLPEPFAFSARVFHALARRMRAGRRYDLVHDVQCLGWGMLGVRRLGLPVVTTIHHPLTVDRRASFMRDRSFEEALGTTFFYPVGMQAAVARRLERVITSSETSAARIARDFRIPESRICNVWNGLDTELFRPDPTVQRSESELLCVGRAGDPTKGVRPLLEALVHLPEPVTLTLVDDAGPDNPARSWARRLGCAERVTFTGRVSNEELVHLYNRAALVVVPSRFEGFGLPAVEAMSCGTPVVATHAGALSEVVELGGGGVLVPLDDLDALAKAIDGLLSQPERRRELGGRARERVVARFSWPRIAAATVEVYREVLAERGRPARTTTSAHDGSLRAQAPSA